MRGVSTRHYWDVIPGNGGHRESLQIQCEPADDGSLGSGGGSTPAPADELKLIIIYVDGIAFGDHIMIGAVGVDVEGHKHVLAIREGA